MKKSLQISKSRFCWYFCAIFENSFIKSSEDLETHLPSTTKVTQETVSVWSKFKAITVIGFGVS